MEVIQNKLMCSDFVPFPSSQEQIEQISACFRFIISSLHDFQNCSERQRFFLMYSTSPRLIQWTICC